MAMAERFVALAVNLVTFLTLLVGLWKVLKKQHETHMIVRRAAKEVIHAAAITVAKADQMAEAAVELQGKVNGSLR